jgi:peptidyl-prolyl isomerase H (cyclophilin H)
MSIDPELQEVFDRENVAVFFDISVGGQPIGRIRLELFVDIAPKCVENFRQFCTGEFKRNDHPVGYKGCPFHRVIKGFMLQSGDFVNQDGTGSTSIYSDVGFADEEFILQHIGPGQLSMANSGPNTNGCQFFLTCGAASWLDGKHVIFGKIIDQDSLLVLRMIENVQVDGNDKPKLPVIIEQCGEL